ncbi:peptidase M10 [Sorangium sp. So ce854]|uniref:peptidase M10 n=1 Tax=Sorangium sp. So ce854 TaxID=3133322 RepID=UPI003F63E820
MTGDDLAVKGSSMNQESSSDRQSWSRVGATRLVLRCAPVVALALTGCADIDSASSFEEAASSEVGDTSLSFEEFRARVYREPARGIYIIDGDEPVLDDAELRAVYERHFQPGALVVNRANGADDIWQGYNRQLDLTYCVSSAFGRNYNAVTQAMRAAADAWRPAHVWLRHRPDQDASCDQNNGNVVFDVRPTSGQQYLAAAFFPGWPRHLRSLFVDSSSFGNIAPYTLTGVLRHEIGHTLGFRHEHTRPEAGTCFEDASWRALTGYDAASVMHYPQCRGANRGDLVLTATDVSGAQSVYGWPSSHVLDVVFYLSGHEDLQRAFGPTGYAAAASHWETAGKSEGRRSSPAFDVQYYRALHGDLQAAFGTNWNSLTDHWTQYGMSEGRRSSPALDVRYYLAAHGDLQAAFGATNYAAALDHYLNYGIYEGRRSAPDFDPSYYLSQNGDLQAAFGATNYAAATYHWIRHGRSEGRRGAP